jgi:hypothetical protein
MRQVQWRTPDHQAFSGGHLTFDRQVDLITTGNATCAVQGAVQGAVQRSSYNFSPSGCLMYSALRFRTQAVMDTWFPFLYQRIEFLLAQLSVSWLAVRR